MSHRLYVTIASAMNQHVPRRVRSRLIEVEPHFGWIKARYPGDSKAYFRAVHPDLNVRINLRGGLGQPHR